MRVEVAKEEAVQAAVVQVVVALEVVASEVEVWAAVAVAEEAMA
jgi:hypothetical protein